MMPTARRAANASTSARRILVCLALLSCLALSPIALADGIAAAVGGAGGIEQHLDGFRVVRQVVVGGIGRSASGVADPCADNAGETPKLGVRSPEST